MTVRTNQIVAIADVAYGPVLIAAFPPSTIFCVVEVSSRCVVS